MSLVGTVGLTMHTLKKTIFFTFELPILQFSNSSNSLDKFNLSVAIINTGDFIKIDIYLLP